MQAALAPALPRRGVLARLLGRARADGLRPRMAAGSHAAELAAQMLCAPTALMQLDAAEARAIVACMEPLRIAEGTTFIREGDAEHTGFMVLVLDGEVTVETIVVSRTEPITVSVLGPGSLIGEMGLIDGAPRSASCTALTTLRCAMLTRGALNELLQSQPRVGAKLMMAISMRLAERVREGQEKLKLYAQLTQAMNEEINELMPCDGSRHPG